MVDAFCRFVTSINDQLGKWIGLLFLPMVFAVVFEVVARYFFNKPQIWTWDVIWMLAGIVAALGGGYCLIYRAHIVLDVLYVHFPKRVKAVLDLLTSSLFFFSVGVFLWLSLEGMVEGLAGSYKQTTLFESLLWPLKLIVVGGIVLLLLQGVVKFRQDAQIAAGKEAQIVAPIEKGELS